MCIAFSYAKYGCMNTFARKFCSALPITCACGYAGPEEKGEGAASKGSRTEQEGEGMLHMTHASTSPFQF
jgi:hypothetical protein